MIDATAIKVYAVNTFPGTRNPAHATALNISIFDGAYIRECLCRLVSSASATDAQRQAAQAVLNCSPA